MSGQPNHQPISKQTTKMFSLSTTAALLLMGLAARPSCAYVLSVEPYLAEWCAAQFPEPLATVVTGQWQAELLKNRNYVRVEQYLGKYCFDIFGSKDLKDQKREETLKKMDIKHVQIEPFLMEWGQKAMLHPTSGGGGLAVPDVETYVTEWCVKGQFHKLMKNKKEALEHAKQYPVKVEVALGPWCFAQFPEEMSGLDEEFYVKRLKTDHVPVEDYLLKWEMTNFHMRGHPELQPKEKKGGWSISLTTLVVLCSIVAAAGYLGKKHPQVVQAMELRVQQLFQSSSTSTSTSANGSDRYGQYNGQLTESMVQFT